ncbi:MAG: hypothetical protein JW787_12785 [Sedimentisphaerales bacterium]|nr:hypothetical protein [Sedimentisphaerales bacterium]
MAILRNFRNILVSSLVLIIFTMPIAAQSPENDQILKSIPAETLFCVRINNFTGSMTQLDQFLSGVSPISVSPLVQGQLTNLLGSPQLAGLNMNGNIAAFGAVLNSQEAQASGMPDIFIGVLAPVTDYKQFIDGIASKTPADSNGVAKILSLGNPVILVTQSGNNALITWANEYDNLVKYKKLMSSPTAGKTSLSSTLDASEAKLAVSEPVWIYGNIQQASKTFGPMLTGAIEGIKASMSNIPAAETGISTAEIQNIMNIYVKMIDTFMKEAKSTSLSINPTAGALKITNVTTAVPGTQIAKMFTSNPSAKENNLLPYLEDGAMMNVAFTIDGALGKEAVDFQAELLSMLGGGKISQENLQKMKALTANVIDCVAGPVVYTFAENAGTKPPFKGKYIIAVKDEKKFQQLLGESTELMTSTGFLDIYKSMGIDAGFKINRGVETYKGVSIDSAKLTLKAIDTAAPQAQMIQSMYGDGFEYRWGIVNGLFASTIGSDSDKTLHELIDKIQAGQAKQLGSETKAALSLIPGAEKADFFVSMNLLRLFKMGSSMVTAIAPLPIPSVDIQTKSSLVIDGKTDNGKMTIHLALPKEHVQEIMKAVMTIQQEMMKSQPAAKM